mgnify:CR=1 FL=1|jgi:hypothetical protein
MAAFFLAFILGVLYGNVFPHLARGITRERYPCALGNGPVPNFFGGWAMLNIAGALTWWLWPVLVGAPFISAVGASLGLLAIGLFHAGPGAFGRREQGGPLTP